MPTPLASRTFNSRFLVGPVLLVLLALVIVACKGRPDATPWCSASPARPDGGALLDPTASTDDAGSAAPTYFRDVKSIIDAKCVRCHTTGGIGPFSLERWDDLFRRIDVVRASVATRHMPPWHAARCCTDYHADASLTDAELDTFVTWLDRGAPIGDARDERVTTVSGVLARADVTLEMPAPYVPAPPPGSTDDNRCFLLKWPLGERKYITGIHPLPGARSVVHHLVVGVLVDDSLEAARKLDASDGRAGFDCTKLRGMGVQDFTILGGGLQGSDYPDGLGLRIEPGATIALNIHYSTASAAPAPDLTKVQFRVDNAAREFTGLAVTNAAWLVGDGMRIEAGEKDAVFHYAYEPTIFTGNKTVMLRSVTPHMHAFASKIVVRIIHDDGTRECLLEIPKWHFGWEQPFWFAKPKELRPGDELYVECHFDNSPSNQPNGKAPRTIAWGGDNQDMCAAFMNFTKGSQ